MIKNSFLFLDRVGYRTEERLWRQGILTWEDFLGCSGVAGISAREKERHDREIERACECLGKGDSRYFRERLKPREHWRLYPEFKDRACYIDIETTGLSPSTSDVTVVGIYGGGEFRSFVKGSNLTGEALAEELSRYRLIISFYGSAFDVPFLLSRYPELRLDQPHIDLCFTGRRIGLRGGLKAIEREIGIRRESDVADVDGFEAVRLWRKWERDGDRSALEKLLEYNQADVESLSTLAETIYQKMRARTFLNITSNEGHRKIHIGPE